MVVSLTPAQGALRVLRGVGLAITSASLSVAAHAAANGSFPDPVTTVVLTTVLAGAGVALADRRRGSRSIVGALVLTQPAIHAFLQFGAGHQAGHEHAEMMMPCHCHTVAMVIGHLLAAAGTGLVLARAEDALFVVARFLRLVLPKKPTPLPAVAPLVSCIPAVSVRATAQLINQRIHGLRGPPLVAW